MIAAASGTDTVEEGIVLGLVVAVGFAISIAFVTAQFETQKPSRWSGGERRLPRRGEPDRGDHRRELAVAD
jgi:hypothetical protein